MKFWRIAICAWFVLWGLLSVSNFRFESENAVMGFLAIVAGLLLIFDR